MKKKISFLFIVALLALSLITPCIADEATTEIVTDITTELATEALTDATEGETAPVEEGADEWEAFKAKITDSATWTMIGAALVTILTTVGTVKSKFDKIMSLVHNKADNETIKGALKDVENDLKEAYTKNHKEVSETLKRYEEALRNTEANEQRLYAIITLFMTNCKISESAKSEILGILADVKKYEGDVSAFVAQAQEAINKKKAEEKVSETPHLDKLLEEDYMELG